MPTTEKTQAAWRRAAQVMPLGVSSNFRYWGDDETPVVKRAKGAYIWDMDDNRYIDYRLGFGPLILGHADDRIDRAVMVAIQNGAVTTAHTNPYEIEAAELIVSLCPGVEQVRFVNSGTEATMHALRVARGYTGRDKVVKFEGNYHGFHDHLLFSTATAPRDALGIQRNPTPVVMSAGIPANLRENLIMLPYNDLESLERVIEARWHEIAAIIVEPIMGNSASVMPDKEWYELIRSLCDEFGIVMLVDEVKTGFRVAKGGANELLGIEGDLMAYAKALGNGYPVGAIGGKADIMSTIGPGKVGQGGTFAGNAVATAAARATLHVLANTDALEKVNAHGQRLMAGMDRILTDAGLPHVMLGVPAMFGFVFADDAPCDYRGVVESDLNLYERLGFLMRQMGVEWEPDPREPLFVSAAHSDGDAEEVLNKFKDAVQVVKLEL